MPTLAGQRDLDVHSTPWTPRFAAPLEPTRPSRPSLPSFVHLKVHSAYSLLEGAITIPRLAKLAAAQGFPAVGLTDTNNLFGALEFSDKLAEAGIQPIVGCTLQVDFGDRPTANGLQRQGANQPRSQPAGAHRALCLRRRRLAEPHEARLLRLLRSGRGRAAAHRDRAARGPRRRLDCADRRAGWLHRQGAARGAEGGGIRAPEGAGEDLRRQALCRNPAPRPQARDRCRAHAAGPRLCPRAADRRHQRGLFRLARRLRGPRCADVHRRGHLRHRGQAAPPLPRALLQDRRADGRAVRGPAGGIGQHHRDRQALRLPSAGAQAHPAALRRGGSGDERGGAAASGDGRAAQAGRSRPRGAPGVDAAGAGVHGRGLPEAPGLRDRRHLQDEVPRLLPDRRRLHPVGQGQRHSRRAGARLGCRLGRGLVAHHHRSRSPALRPAVRAVPEPRAPVDARLRHRLLPGPPRRGDPLRAEEVRRRPRGADHHARQAAGARRAARRRPRAADALRPGRQALQARAQQPGQSRDAGAGHRKRAQAAGGARQRGRRGAPAGDRPEARGALPPCLDARRRHGDRRPSPRRAGAALPRSQVELPHHPIQLEAGRGGGPREVRLPRPQDAHRAAQGRAADRARARH